jgi:hypothetical protein
MTATRRGADDAPAAYPEVSELCRLALHDVAAARRRYRVRRDAIVAGMRFAAAAERTPWSSSEASLILQFETDEAVRAEAEVLRDRVKAKRRRLFEGRA